MIWLGMLGKSHLFRQIRLFSLENPEVRKMLRDFFELDMWFFWSKKSEHIFNSFKKHSKDIQNLLNFRDFLVPMALGQVAAGELRSTPHGGFDSEFQVGCELTNPQPLFWELTKS